MATITFSGTDGILSGTFDLEEIERRAAEERKKEAEAVEREAEQAETASGIENALTPYLKNELQQEIAARKLSAETLRKFRKDFQAFKECCERWDLPHLPAPPQAVAVFLSEESRHGVKHVERLKASISAIHKAADFSDPTTDILIRAILRLCRNDTTPTKPKEN
jgi:hypothetical protein